jgi:hypothetical protein
LQRATLIGPLLKKKKKKENMEAPQNRRLYFERRTTSAKAYGMKVSMLGNTLGTHWELKRNIVVHKGNQGKMENMTPSQHW